MENSSIRLNKYEYLHITKEQIFVFNSEHPTFIPEELPLGEQWSIGSMFNYIAFCFLITITFSSVIHYGIVFVSQPLNYAMLFLLILSFRRIVNGFHSSRTPCIKYEKIKSVFVKTPQFSYPRIVIYFEGPEGKVLRRIFRVRNPKEAENKLSLAGILK